MQQLLHCSNCSKPVPQKRAIRFARVVHTHVIITLDLVTLSLRDCRTIEQSVITSSRSSIGHGAAAWVLDSCIFERKLFPDTARVADCRPLKKEQRLYLQRVHARFSLREAASAADLASCCM